MMLTEATNRLRAAGVPDWLYVTDGSLGTGECLGIEPVSGGWSIYYSERGRKSPVETHPNEDAACRAFLCHMDRMMRESGRNGIPGVSIDW